jgi:hypothetical protein
MLMGLCCFWKYFICSVFILRLKNINKWLQKINISLNLMKIQTSLSFLFLIKCCGKREVTTQSSTPFHTGFLKHNPIPISGVELARMIGHFVLDYNNLILISLSIPCPEEKSRIFLG